MNVFEEEQQQNTRHYFTLNIISEKKEKLHQFTKHGREELKKRISDLMSKHFHSSYWHPPPPKAHAPSQLNRGVGTSSSLPSSEPTKFWSGAENDLVYDDITLQLLRQEVEAVMMTCDDCNVSERFFMRFFWVHFDNYV